jgi:predicted ATP-binding protein involved in virulence
MKIKQLKIQAFRGIDDLTLEFDHNAPTVLLGINGAGKSSILNCLTSLLSIFPGMVRCFEQQDVVTMEQVRQLTLNPQFMMTQRFTQLFDDQDIKFSHAQTKVTLTLDLDVDSEPLVISCQKRHGGSRLTFYDEIGLMSEFIFKRIYQPLMNLAEAEIDLFVHYSVERAVSDIPLDTLPEEQLGWRFIYYDVLDQKQSSLKRGYANFSSFFQWFRSREDLENERVRDDANYRDPQLEAVRTAIQVLQSNTSDLRIRRSPLRMTVIKDQQELVISQLSDGEKCLIAMVGDLARRLAIANSHLDNPLTGAGIVLIDEIELHLHPQWQRGVIPKLTATFPNCQFIVTTHSPQVIADVKPENVYILESTPQGITACHPESSYGRDSNRILEDLMGVSERPEPIKAQLKTLFRLIDEGNLGAARQLQSQIEASIGESDPEFVKADILIRRKEVLGK